MSPRRMFAVLAVLLPFYFAGCATSSHDEAASEPTWRQDGRSSAATVPAEPIPVYVARFGIADSVAEEHPELREAGVGLGLGSRIADGLWESGRFRFLEEKAEMASRLDDLDQRTGNPEPRAPDEAGHVLYGEITEVTTRRSERVSGFSGGAATTTEVTVQLRLVNRETREAIQAHGTGRATVDTPSAEDDLQPRVVGDATEDAVRRAAEDLLRRLERGPK